MFFSWKNLNAKGKCLFVILSLFLITAPLTISFGRTIYYIITTDTVKWTPHEFNSCSNTEPGYKMSNDALVIDKAIWFCTQNSPVKTKIISNQFTDILPVQENASTATYLIDPAYLPDDWQIVANLNGDNNATK
jgi:hypothetical protein